VLAGEPSVCEKGATVEFVRAQRASPRYQYLPALNEMPMGLTHRVSSDHAAARFGGEHVGLRQQLDTVLGLAVPPCEHGPVRRAKFLDNLTQRQSGTGACPANTLRCRSVVESS